mmetsp:Transcript_13434/g.29177  ORF Transcript_13434/g.29177 Transcript_13434/m.29177 type:complete len:374 (-) Transcript_13434:187-1308(-)|eukprot:CAMPEP_0172318912 /NCGR_PEP_ID=MMETSP1058-20130122/36217_1 /TAXON_ID=83371 /ORGANISM="Detonula confervacea, Strain CCMP 353" /LENGTH=373 /DNA_ID=CAMNT_0013033837 /DNA_START=85 /DNA_END=1206 /DNA_ORIENTATION=+
MNGIFNDGEADPLSDNQSNYPEWSWDHVRSWVAIRRGDKFSDDQILALSSQDVVMLEKFTGHETYGTVEKGTLEAAKRIKGVNSKVKVLFYLNAMVHYQGYEANKDFKNDWAMWNPKRNDYHKWRDKFLSYDHTKLEFREWWVQRALDMVAHDEIDGVFIDGICKVGMRWLPTKNHGRAYLTTANQLRNRLPPGKILIGNALRSNDRASNDGNLSHLKYLDGSYLEGWAHPETLAGTIQLMSVALKQGRIIMLTAEPAELNKGELNEIKSLDERYDFLNKPKHINFPLGFFLLTVEPHSYFSFHVGVDGRPRAKTVFDNTRFDAITRKLGKPTGDYVREGDSFSREFEMLKLHINIKTRAAELTVKDERGDEL